MILGAIKFNNYPIMRVRNKFEYIKKLYSSIYIIFHSYNGSYFEQRKLNFETTASSLLKIHTYQRESNDRNDEVKVFSNTEGREGVRVI